MQSKTISELPDIENPSSGSIVWIQDNTATPKDRKFTLQKIVDWIIALFGTVVTRDVGTSPDEVPINTYLGTMAYEDLPVIVEQGGTGATSAADARGNLSAVGYSTVTGSAFVPVGTEAQRDAVPQEGYFRFNNETTKFEGYNGIAWGSVGGGATGGGSDEVFVENGQVVTVDYTVAANKNALSTGPITIADGVTVTIADGARWVVL